MVKTTFRKCRALPSSGTLHALSRPPLIKSLDCLGRGHQGVK